MSEADSKPPPDESDTPRELLLVGGRVEESGGYRVLRQKRDRVEVGELRNLQEGKPFNGEIVRLHPTEQHDRVFECETLHEPDPARGTAAGPAQVANASYRRNWDQIFGALAQTLDAAEQIDDDPVDPSKLN